MGRAGETQSSLAFVIKPEEIAALNYLAPNHPRPRGLTWVNWARERNLRQSSVEMLLRTLHRNVSTRSVARLHRESELHAIFRTEKDRNAFAKAFAAAKDALMNQGQNHVTAIFDRQHEAEKAIVELIEAGMPKKSISLMARADQFVVPKGKWPEGHSKFSIAASATGGGLAGVAFGLSLVLVPGFGLIALGGGLAVSAFGAFAAASGIFGATGGALARMLTDHDVDGISATFFQEQVRRGKIFVSVDARVSDGQRETAREILARLGGRSGQTKTSRQS